MLHEINVAGIARPSQIFWADGIRLSNESNKSDCPMEESAHLESSEEEDRRLSCVRRGQGECASSKRKQITATHSAWKLLMIIVGKHKESVDSTWSGEKGVFSRACLHLWVSWVGPWASWCQPDTHVNNMMLYMIYIIWYTWYTRWYTLGANLISVHRLDCCMCRLICCEGDKSCLK